MSGFVETAPEAVELKAAPRLLARLNTTHGTTVARLTVNDHYVDVYLSNGEKERLLMRFADAVAEMDGVAGVATHRSHWVAEDKILRLTKDGTRDFLELSCGTQVPVSRRFRPSVAAAVARKAAKQ